MVENVYQDKNIKIDFINEKGFYQVLMGNKKGFIFDERSLEDLALSEDTRELNSPFLRKLQLLNEPFYASLVREEVNNLHNALKQVHSDYEKRVQKFRKSMDRESNL